MEELTRYDVAEYNGISMVVVESDLLPPDPSVVVIPLLSGYPAVRHLNPELLHDGKPLILATRLITAVRRSSLRRIGNVADQSDLITRAVDVLMAGVQLQKPTRFADTTIFAKSASGFRETANLLFTWRTPLGHCSSWARCSRNT